MMSDRAPRGRYRDMTEASSAAADFLRTMANESRLAVLCALVEGEHSVGQLQKRTGINPSPLSQHLARLRQDEVVATRRDGQTIYYSIADRNVYRILDLLHELFCP